MIIMMTTMMMMMMLIFELVRYFYFLETGFYGTPIILSSIYAHTLNSLVKSDVLLSQSLRFNQKSIYKINLCLTEKHRLSFTKVNL